MKFATMRSLSSPLELVVAPANDDWSPMLPVEPAAVCSQARVVVSAVFQKAALAVSKQAHV